MGYAGEPVVSFSLRREDGEPKRMDVPAPDESEFAVLLPGRC